VRLEDLAEELLNELVFPREMELMEVLMELSKVLMKETFLLRFVPVQVLPWILMLVQKATLEPVDLDHRINNSISICI